MTRLETNGSLNDEDFEAMLLLLKAPAKDFVVNFLKQAFDFKDESVFAKDVASSIQDTLQITADESSKLAFAVTKLIRKVLYLNASEKADVLQCFPETFHKSLKELLTKIVLENLPAWRTTAIGNQVSMPRLADFSWRVDVKSASRDVTRMSAPSCLLQLKVDDTTESNNGFIQHVNVELSKETLDTILDGLGKIRDQLKSVAAR